jgi:micrococcal nuclease
MSQRRLMRLAISLITVVVLSLLGVSVGQTGKLSSPDLAQPIQPGTYAVSHVSDGDTFAVKMNGKSETVRMIGIDTPETKDPSTTVQCFGVAASNKTKELLAGKSVRLEADPQSDNRDKYQRLLRYVYLPDGTFLNQYLVEQGYAFAYTLFPNSKLDQFRAWEQEARANNRGLWAGCNVDESNQKKQTTGPK